MALDRLTPTSGPKTGSAYATEVQEEVTGLWDRSTITLTTTSGATDTITATATPALTGSLGGSMNFILKPAQTNTGAVTLNINSSGAVAVVDAEGTALTAGAIRVNANYFLHYDSGISKFVVVNYTPAAAVTVGSKLIATCDANSVPSNFDFFNGATPGVGSGGTGTVTASGTVVLDNTYDAYQLVISNLRPTTDDRELWLRVGTGATPTYQATLYDYVYHATGTGTAQALQNTTAATRIVVGQNQGAASKIGNAAEEGVSCVITFDNPENATFYKLVSFQGTYMDTGAELFYFVGSGIWKSTTAITAVRIMFETGTITSGRATLYGLTKS